MIITKSSDGYKVQFGEVTLVYTGDFEVCMKGRDSFLITGPGEYEVGGLLIKGLASSVKNTVYTVNLENMNVCFLGNLDSALPGNVIEELNEVDILFAAGGVISPSESYKIAVSLESKLIIPTFKEESALKTFLKEAGSNPERLEKLTIKRKDVEGKKGEIVILK